MPKETYGGIAPTTACRAMEIAVRRWLAIKYGFICMDEDGGAIYQIHPSHWQEGDLEFANNWNEWFERDPNERYMHEFKTLVEEGRERRVDTLVLNALFPTDRKVPWYIKVGALVGGGFLLKHILEPPKPISVPNLPVIDTKPIEDLFQEMAGEQPKAAIKYDMTPVVYPGDEVETKEKVK